MNIKHTENAFNDLNEQWREEMEKTERALQDAQSIIEKMKSDLENMLNTWKGIEHE